MDLFLIKKDFYHPIFFSFQMNAYLSKNFIIKTFCYEGISTHFNAFQRISTHFNAFQRISTHLLILFFLMSGLQSELLAQPYNLYDCENGNPIDLDPTAAHCATCSSIDYPPTSVCPNEVASRVYASPLAGQEFCYPEIQPQNYYLHIEVEFKTGSGAQGWTVVRVGYAYINDPFEMKFRFGNSGYYRYKIKCMTTNGSSDPKDHTELGCYRTGQFQVNVSGFSFPADFTVDLTHVSQSNLLIPYVSCNARVLAEWNYTHVSTYYDDCWSWNGPFCQYKWVTYVDGNIYNDPGFTSGLPPAFGERIPLPVLQTSGHIVTLELQLMRDGCSSSSSIDFYYLGQDGTTDLPIDFRVSSFFVNEYDLDSDIIPGGDCNDPAFIGGTMTQPYVLTLPDPRINISSFDIEVFEFDNGPDCGDRNINGTKVAYHDNQNMAWNSSVQNYIIEGATPPNPLANYWGFNTFDQDERWKLDLELEVQCADNEFITLSGSTIFKVRPEDMHLMPGDPSSNHTFEGNVASFSSQNENLEVVLRQTLPKSEKGQLHIFDVKGTPLMSLNDISTNTIQVHQQFAPGIYFYYFVDKETNETKRGKMIIVR